MIFKVNSHEHRIEIEVSHEKRAKTKA